MRKIGFLSLLGLFLYSFSAESFAQSFTVLHAFSTNADGQYPEGGVTLSGDTLFGTTMNGDNGSGYDFGIIYSVSTNGSNYTILHSFTGPDGQNPVSIPVISGGTLYGTADSGGTNMSQIYYGGGVIYSMGTNGSNFTVLHSFGNGPDGTFPEANLLLSGSTLFGTTTYSSDSNLFGSIYSIDTSGSNFTVIHVFSNSITGAQPCAGQLVLSGNTLYGMTSAGGSNNLGTIYSIDVSGSNFNILHQFDAAGGATPQGSLVLSSNTLYGVTQLGGSNRFGVIFAIGADGSNYRQLHVFNTNSDGDTPQQCTLTLSGSSLYGTASASGTGNSGTVFSMETDGSSYQVLHNFSYTNGGATEPLGTLLLSGSQLFGVTPTGGANGVGTLFTLASQPPPQHPPFFNGEIQLTSDIYYLSFPDGNLFGYYSDKYFPYVYHQDLGFEYFFDAKDGQGGAYLYDFTSNDFWFTNPAVFPYMYNFTLNAWCYYFLDTQAAQRYTHNPRYFYNFSTKQVITR